MLWTNRNISFVRYFAQFAQLKSWFSWKLMDEGKTLPSRMYFQWLIFTKGITSRIRMRPCWIHKNHLLQENCVIMQPITCYLFTKEVSDPSCLHSETFKVSHCNLQGNKRWLTKSSKLSKRQNRKQLYWQNQNCMKAVLPEAVLWYRIKELNIFQMLLNPVLDSKGLARSISINCMEIINNEIHCQKIHL